MECVFMTRGGSAAAAAEADYAIPRRTSRLPIQQSGTPVDFISCHKHRVEIAKYYNQLIKYCYCLI